jgi:undecaprenyl-diphosphatase
MKSKLYLTASIILLTLFLIFTVIVTTVDVKPIGPNGSEVGLASINEPFADAVGFNELWYNISEYVGLIPLAIAGCFAILGICQAIKRKSLLKIDSHLFILAAFYAMLLFVYLDFELITVNYRPIILDGELEASYPSSHTMLSLGIMTTAIFELHELIKDKKAILIAADILCGAIALVILLGRLLSGVHWLTDIFAGILVSAALICLYRYGILFAQNMKSKKQKENTVND